MIPVVLISGYSDSGKTTIIEQLLRYYTDIGLEVSTVKHHKGSFDIGENKDSGKHLKAGASSVTLSSNEDYIVIKKLKKEISLKEILANITGADLILVEGYKNENYPKVEIFREELGKPRIEDRKNIFGIVSDQLKEAEEGVPVFKTDQIIALAEFIQKKFIKER